MEGEKESITLTSGEGEDFLVEKTVAMKLGLVKGLMEDLTDDKIPVPNVTSWELRYILNYCEESSEEDPAPAVEDDGDEEKAAAQKAEAKKLRDRKFTDSLNNNQLPHLIMAANYLNVAGLLELLVDTIADRIKNRSVEYVRRLFGVENDFTPEELEKLREETAWAFEGLDPDDDIDQISS